jgi:uncharacterized protein with ATP-grasp and redox domains
MQHSISQSSAAAHKRVSFFKQYHAAHCTRTPALQTDEKDSFASFTMSDRFPSIVRKVADQNKHLLSTETFEQLYSLGEEIASGAPLRPLRAFSETDNKMSSAAAPAAWSPTQGYNADWKYVFDTHGTDGWAKVWKNCCISLLYVVICCCTPPAPPPKTDSQLGQLPVNFPYSRQMPWMIAECYCFRLLLDITEYHVPSSKLQSIDPFQPQKLEELSRSHTWEVVAGALSRSMDASHTSSLQEKLAVLRDLLQFALWGNRMDLSLESLVKSQANKAMCLESEQKNLLVNDVDDVLSKWESDWKTMHQLNYVVDNAGTELLLDLVAVDFMLRSNLTSHIALFLKGEPTYVSDAMIEDVHIHIAHIDGKGKELAEKSETAAIGSMLIQWGKRLQRFVNCRQLQLVGDVFFNSFYYYDQLTPELRRKFEDGPLTITKGDMNYRRLLLDHRYEDLTVPLSQVASFFPTNVLALRTLKSDAICGLTADAVSLVMSLPEEDKWRVNGKRGIMQAALW